MRAHLVQRVAVLMHFDERYAADVYAGKAVAGGLRDDERALLTRVDARAFRTDPERGLRLLAALLDEYPVSAAVAGASSLPAFLTSSPFHNAVVRDRLIVDAFGDWLCARAGGVAQLELAVALARRRRRRHTLDAQLRARPARETQLDDATQLPARPARETHVEGASGGESGAPVVAAAHARIARAPRVEIARVPRGTLAFWIDARTRITVDDVARGTRIGPPPYVSETNLAQEHLLVTCAHDGASPDVATCAEPLFALLSFVGDAKQRGDVVEEARRLGADDDAADLVADLVRDGLLIAV